MSLSVDEQRDLRTLLTLFFPGDQGMFEQAAPNEQTLELTETMLIEVTACTKASQGFIEDLADHRMIKGFLRRSLKRLLSALKGKDSRFVGNIGCTNQGKARFRSPILATLI